MYRFVLFYAAFSIYFVLTFAFSVEDTVQELKTQVSTLLEQREREHHQLKELVKKSLDSDKEIFAFKNEIKDLRSQVESLRTDQSTITANGNRFKNEQITVQWLSNSISELRSEMGELAKSFNSTAELQQQQSLSTDISILQNDVVSLRHDLESFKAEFVKSVVKMSAMSQDVEVATQLSHSTAALTANLTDELQVAVSDWSRTVKAMQKKKDKVFKRMVVVKEDPLDMKVITSANGNGRYRRHNKALVKQIVQMKENMDELRESQKNLNYQLLNLEQHLPASTQEIEVKVMEDLEGRMLKLETLNEALNRSVTVLNSQMNGQEKLHTSMLELLESVENLETKVDSTTPDLKREISKLEFSLAQITSTTALLKEDQDNQRMSVRALGEGLSTMQAKMANYQNEVANLSTKFWSNSPSSQRINKEITFENTTEVNDHPCSSSSNIENTFRRLSAVQSQYLKIVNQLPKDCHSVNGESGLYLIAPNSDMPMFVYCEIESDPTKTAYTIVQRRINGNQDFNKNWEEYAHGFGNPSGEFWLGNEAIHQLTKNNDTMARIDFRDITGKWWYAEYSEFSVAPRNEGYRLHVAGYSGNASDALEYQNRMQFSTVDSDRDISNTNCAANYEGGWWFSHCQHTNLNGKYNLGLTWFDQKHNEWIAVAFTEIKIRKRKVD